MPLLKNLLTWIGKCGQCGNRMERKYIDKPVTCSCGWTWKAWDYNFDAVKHATENVDAA